MVEFTNVEDNSEEIANCIVNCDTAQEQNNQNSQANENLLSSMADEEEYIDEP